MFEKTQKSLKRIYEQETPAERSQRIIPAAGFGALIATAYIWTFFFVLETSKESCY